jgi:hypothetical protein
LVSDDSGLCAWVVNVWLPGKAACAQALQEYVEKTWPEFDWARASEQHRGRAAASGGFGPRHAFAVQELLARCVAAAQSGLYYRVLASWADDPELREIVVAMAQSEAESLARFRGAYEARVRMQRFGFTAAWRSVRACVRAARDMHVQLAFRAISTECGANMPFPVSSYDEFLRRMRSIIQRHGAIGIQERVLLGGWMRPSARIRAETPAHRVPDWFKPLFAATA